MAPPAKRKKPGEDDNAVKPPPKSRAKKQKIDADSTAGIETPPPTPKPAGAARGRKPNAAKATKVNGTHAHTNGAVKEVALGEKTGAEEQSEDQNGTAASHLRSEGGKAEGTPTVNGQVNGVNGVEEAAPAVETNNQPAASPQGAPGNAAKDATPVIQSADQSGSQIPAAAILNGHAISNSLSADSQNVRPSTERPPTNMEALKKKEKVKSKELQMVDQLYDWCKKKKPLGEIWSIEELKKGGVTTDDHELLHICSTLVKRFLFSPMTLNRGLVYKTRSYEVARKLATVSENHNIIYSLIENTGGAGAWLRPLENKSGLNTGVVRKCLKELVVLKVIQEIKSADTSKKTYISVDVKPDDKHIGGGFIDEGKFDIGLINSLTFVVGQFLTERGWHKSDIRVSDDAGREGASANKHKSKTSASRPEKASKEKTTITIDDSTDTPSMQPPPARERKLYPPWSIRGKAYVPNHPSYYNNYPTTLDVMFHINENGALKDCTMTLKDTEQLLEKMAFDGHVERMRNGQGEMNMKEPKWRAARRLWRSTDATDDALDHFGHIEPKEDFILPGNGLSQVPCARCPVKAKCKPGGVVSPEECKYLDDWLAF